MVSVVNKSWVTRYFPKRELLAVDEVLSEEKIQIRAANDADIIFITSGFTRVHNSIFGDRSIDQGTNCGI